LFTCGLYRSQLDTIKFCRGIIKRFLSPRKENFYVAKN
jgi:hypothetical protein